MLVQRLIIQDADNGRPSEMLRAIREAVTSTNPTSSRVAVAFATGTGCSELLTSMQKACHAWRSVKKAWLIGIDHGVTEPAALEEIACQPNSEVRIPNAEYLLANGLRPSQRFHPKTYIFERQTQSDIESGGIVCGSCNLTFSGLRTGTEQALLSVLSAPSNKDDREQFKRIIDRGVWWDDVWSSAIPYSASLLKRYGEARPESVPNEDESVSIKRIAGKRRTVIDTDTAVGWAFSRCFWIQTFELYKNRGRDKPGNQVDCRRGTRVYFGFPPDAVPRNTVFGNVSIRYEHFPSVERSVRFANNMMDKVNLPVPGTEGPESYDHCYLHFERLRPNTFQLRIAKKDEEKTWRKKSKQQGLYDTMNGDREFGFYS